MTTQQDLLGLSDEGVLITGATSLISVWTARMMLDAGARVVMTDRLAPDAMRAAFEAYAARFGEPGLALADGVELVGPVDIRNATPEDAKQAGKAGLLSVQEMVAAARGHLGRIDVLINIAGGQEPVPAAALTADVFRRTVDRILIGTWNVIHQCFEQGMRDHGGRILTVTADVDQGYPMMPAMGAARNGLTSLHRAIATEWAEHGVTCCVIAPGATDTPGLDRYPTAEQTKQIAVRAANLGRLLDAREIAYLFLTMASPWAASVNGHVVVANGGDSNVTPLYRELQRLLGGDIRDGG